MHGGAAALIVDDDRRGLAHHAPSQRANREAEVGVLVIGWEIALVEPAGLIPCLAADHRRAERHVVDVAPGEQLRLVGRQGSAEMRGAAIAPNDVPSLLQSPVPEQDAATNHSGARVVVHGAVECREPSRGCHRVVVDEHKTSTAREAGGPVAPPAEAMIDRGTDQHDVLAGGDRGQSGGWSSVGKHQNLCDRTAFCTGRHRRQASLQPIRSGGDQDDDRHLGRVRDARAAPDARMARLRVRLWRRCHLGARHQGFEDER